MKTAAEALTGIHNPPLTRDARCDIHGEYEGHCYLGNAWTGCPACAREQSVKARAEVEVKERFALLAAWRRKIGDAGIPERFHDRSLQSFVATTERQARALAFAQGYADRFDEALATGRSALFIGRPGTGKTHLAVGIGLRIMHRDGRSVLFTTVLRALRRVKAAWRRDSKESESEAIAALAGPDLLILDEVGVQFGSDTEKLILFDVLNERYEKRRPTLLLSNLTLDEVKTYLGERVFDRLREDGGEAIPFDWASWRGRVRKGDA